MNCFEVRNVPPAMRQDGWWLSDIGGCDPEACALWGGIVVARYAIPGLLKRLCRMFLLLRKLSKLYNKVREVSGEGWSA